MTTYYVDGAVGSDLNDGLAEGAGNAWATIDHAMNNVIAGDIVYVKAGSGYIEDVTLDTVAVSGNPIIFEGYSTTPGDNGKAILTASTTNCMFTAQFGACYYIFKNMGFTGASSDGVNFNNADQCVWINCDFYSNGQRGVSGDNQHLFLHCTAYSNSSTGIDVDNGGAVGCIAYSNGSSHNQIDINGADFFIGNVVYGVGGTGSGIRMQVGTVVAYNTVDGEGGVNTRGISNSDVDCSIFNNIVYNCNVGISTILLESDCFVGYNLLNSNTTDYSPGLVAAYLHHGLGDVTSAPAFTDEAGDDYTLSDDSPAINAGIKPGGIT